MGVEDALRAAALRVTPSIRQETTVRRALVAISVAALAASALAFAPAPGSSDADTGAEATVTEDGEVGAPADSAPRVDVTMLDFNGTAFDTEEGGDWNGGGDGAEVGSAMGQDFEAAYLEYGDDTFTFTLEMTELPAIGGMPEFTRYGWSFAYVSGDDVLELELDGKFTNYSRGACDPTAGTCPPPRDPGMSPFLIRGNCYKDTSLPMTLTLCEELAYVSADFDPAEGTITVEIPASALAPDGVKACDRIEGRASFIGESIWAAPSAFITNTLMPFDDAGHHTPLVVPYADPELTC